MIRGTPCLLVLLGAAALAGCGGAASPADVAAQACDAQVRQQLGSKPYTLDLAELAANKADDGRGGQLLKAKVVVNAGLADQTIQDLECTVRANADGSAVEVLDIRFIW
jgi:hypothetical protein